jgi:rhodanese-related sulfurtransferase
MFALLMGLKSIAPSELKAVLPARDVVVVDVNDRSRWLTARVPGSINLSPMTFADDDLPSDRDTPLVFYCSGYLCRKAPNAAKRAKAMGYTNVRVMSAGIDGWVGANFPTSSGQSDAA